MPAFKTTHNHKASKSNSFTSLVYTTLSVSSPVKRFYLSEIEVL